jgi:hypothetical protein
LATPLVAPVSLPLLGAAAAAQAVTPQPAVTVPEPQFAGKSKFFIYLTLADSATGLEHNYMQEWGYGAEASWPTVEQAVESRGEC